MNSQTKYKLVSLAFFFVLFTALFIQFVYPYHLVPATDGPNRLPTRLAYNFLIFPLALIAALLFGLQLAFYFPVRKSVKLLSLIGPALLLALLFYIHAVNHPAKLDSDTRQKIMERFGENLLHFENAFHVKMPC